MISGSSWLKRRKRKKPILFKRSTEKSLAQPAKTLKSNFEGVRFCWNNNQYAILYSQKYTPPHYVGKRTSLFNYGTEKKMINKQNHSYKDIVIQTGQLNRGDLSIRTYINCSALHELLLLAKCESIQTEVICRL